MFRWLARIMNQGNSDILPIKMQGDLAYIRVSYRVCRVVHLLFRYGYPQAFAYG